jgi:hypothetical protein
MEDLKQFLRWNRETHNMLRQKADSYMNEVVSKAYTQIQASYLGELPPSSKKLKLIDKYAQKVNEAINKSNRQHVQSQQIRTVLKEQLTSLSPEKLTLKTLKGRQTEDLNLYTSNRSRATFTKEFNEKKKLSKSQHKLAKESCIKAYSQVKLSKDSLDRNSSSPVKIRQAARSDLQSLKTPLRRRNQTLAEGKMTGSLASLKTT